MITDKDITFICHVRLDNRLREKNIILIYKYYKKYLPNAQFIFVEDSKISTLSNVINLQNNDIIIHKVNEYQHLKGASYNIGAEQCNTDILIFLDIDVIIDCDKLLSVINNITNSACIIGYNGIALYYNLESEKDFANTLDIKDLNKFTKTLKFINNEKTEHLLVGNINAVGGCLIMHKSTYSKINGFNPYFTGWGFEDNEIIIRAKKLGIEVYKSNLTDHFLYHLEHSIDNQDKSDHIFYNKNENILNFVKLLTPQLLTSYIKQW